MKSFGKTNVRHSLQSNYSHRGVKFEHRTLAPLESLQMISSSRNKFLIGASSPSLQQSSDLKLLTFGLKDNNTYKNLATTNNTSNKNSRKALNAREIDCITDPQLNSLLKKSNAGRKEDVMKRNKSTRKSRHMETLEDDVNLEQGVIPRNQSVQQAMGLRVHSEESERNQMVIESNCNKESILNSDTGNIVNSLAAKPPYYVNWTGKTGMKKRSRMLNDNINSSKEHNVVMLNEIKAIQKEVLERKYRLKYAMTEKDKGTIKTPVYIETVDPNQLSEEYKDSTKPSDSIAHDFRSNIAKLPQSKNIQSYYEKKQKSKLQRSYNEVEVQVTDDLPRIEDKIKLDGSINHENVMKLIRIGLLLLLESKNIEVLIKHSISHTIVIYLPLTT